MNELTRDEVIEVVYELPLEKLVKRHDEFISLCPFHSEKDGSFHISLKDNLLGVWNCLGCHSSGNLFELYKYFTGESLAKRLGWSQDKTPANFKLIKNKQEKTKEISLSNMSKEIDIIAKIRDVSESRQVLHYLRQRDISLEQAKSFGMFWIDHGFVGFKNCEKREWTNRLIVPIVNDEGMIVSFEGRDFTRKQTLKCLYPKESKTCSTIYNIRELDYSKPLVIVEGIMDYYKTANALKILGVQVSTVFGTQVSEFQLAILRRFSKIITLYDGDKGGHNGNLYLLERLGKDFEVGLFESGDPCDNTHDTIRKTFMSRISCYDFEYLYNNELLNVSNSLIT